MKANHIYAIAIIVLLLLIAGATVVIAAVYYTTRIQSTGSIKGIGINIYWDANGTMGVSSINWGMLEPGQSDSVTLYIESTSNVPVNLTMYVENWTPANASNWVSIFWNCEGQTLQPDEIIPVVLTITIDAGITGISTFSNDIVIAAAG